MYADMRLTQRRARLLSVTSASYLYKPQLQKKQICIMHLHLGYPLSCILSPRKFSRRFEPRHADEIRERLQKKKKLHLWQ